MTRIFKNFEEYHNFYENTKHRMNAVDIVNNIRSVCADGEFECKSWKTALRRLAKAVATDSRFDGWCEQIKEMVENGCWSQREPGEWAFGVELLDEGRWYLFINTSC